MAASPPSRRWHDLDRRAVATALDTDLLEGLTEAEAERRLVAIGRNRIEEVETTRRITSLVRQFTSPFILILLFAAAISAALGEVVDALAIAAILLLNGLLGFFQEWRAERALAALRRMLQATSTVIRSGRRQTVESLSLVPGDLVSLEVGDRVPADVRIVEAVNFRTDESSLTGESAPVQKSTIPVAPDTPPAERTPIGWMGTTVSQGRALGLIVATGMRTEFGRIAHLTQVVSTEQTPLARRLAILARQLGIVSITIAIVVGVVGTALGRDALEMFLTGVSLAVAVVPEGLPAVVTITLALGVRSMTKRRALLRRLQAAEALGEASVICTDKTGTLTENQMTVREIWLPAGSVLTTGSGYDPAGHFELDGQRVDYRARPDLLAALKTGLICNDARVSKEAEQWVAIGDPTEAALVVAGYKAWLDGEERLERVAEFSFSSERKRMTVIARSDTDLTAHVKGAPEAILERATHFFDGEDDLPLDQSERQRVTQAYEALAADGLRTLALARRRLDANVELQPDQVESDLTLLGFVGILDPPRPEVRAAIATAREAGIAVVMITGDAPATALAIARRIGLGAERAITGSELDELDDETLIAALEGDAAFARTMPEQKLRIVDLLQSRGHVVGMTGDGVNDAPALKKADIGIAMGIRGTDVAKDASDIIITDDNFASIMSAVEEGRRQFDNIQKFVRYLLSSNVGEVTAILTNLIAGGPLILLPVQILWMNLVTDGATALALGAEPAEKGLMRRPPRAPADPIVSRLGLLMLLSLGAYIGIATLWLFHHYRTAHGPGGVVVAQTVAFTGIILLEKMNVFNFRSLRGPLSHVGFASNRWLLTAWAGTIGLQVVAVYFPPLQRVLGTVPLQATDWFHMAAVALPVFLVPELVKWGTSRRKPGLGGAQTPQINAIPTVVTTASSS